jgi:hypothetical protein
MPPTDYSTTNTTAEDVPVVSFTDQPWFQRPVIDWVPEMSSKPTPRTPLVSGSAGPRSNVGVAWPR